MRLSTLSLSLLANALTSVSAATTVTASSSSTATTCNPLSTSSCSPDKALATSIAVDFTEASDYFGVYSTADEIFYNDTGLTLTLAERFDNPSLKSKFYIMFGRVEVELKSSYGQGVVSSFYLQSDDLDEIDMEWFGGDASQMQSNYFSKGDTSTYDRGEYHDMADPRSDYHTYALDWTSEELTWSIDGTVVRTLKNTSSEGYPQTPMYVMMGIWAGGDSTNAEGTIEWAGGETDYSDAPFSMYIRNLVVSDYSTGSEYSYSDQSGDWTSIESTDGEINGRKSKADKEFSALVSGSSGSSSADSETSTQTKSSTNTKSSTETTSSTETKSSSKTSSSKSGSTSSLASSSASGSTKSSSKATTSISAKSNTKTTLTSVTKSKSNSSTSNSVSVSDSGSAPSFKLVNSQLSASSISMIVGTLTFIVVGIVI
ncbi:unnamed protein product [Kuraishia capsulata CBS 1993]|uniref:Crh-like protein n=1 Tax=Kuraishia capsulata CBS 1993 TaxID=1382522 RepID=W6MJA1_9ASCO|nr:uncharacterized protein KUCA_T00001999001 [Kuraishia capsulata CBS 1993]CDK26028.1 unnamed protein product [Kuraishia capsulata CBS 1993]